MNTTLGWITVSDLLKDCEGWAGGVSENQAMCLQMIRWKVQTEQVRVTETEGRSGVELWLLFDHQLTFIM